jgi:hypothetical protein
VQVSQAGGSSNSGTATPRKTTGPAAGALANKVCVGYEVGTGLLAVVCLCTDTWATISNLPGVPMCSSH